MLPFKRLSKLSGLAAALLLTACAESAMSPTPVNPGLAPATANPATLAADFVDINAQFGWLPKLSPTKTMKGDTTIQKVTIDPKAGALVSFGTDHKVVIYPWAICDLETSGYGPSYWLKTCTQETTPIAFTFKSWKNAIGRPAMHVSPNVRFVPGSLVRIYFHDATLTNFSKLYIPYCTDAGSCVDEGATDSWQQTFYAPGVPGYWVLRNLRHFSGYNVWA